MPLGRDGGHGAERCREEEKKKRMFSQNPNRSKLSETPFVEVCVRLET